MFIAPVDWVSAGLHTVVPQIADAGALLLAVGIIGATVMPHAVYLHSGLTQARVPVRSDDERRRVLRYSNQEVVIALVFAGLVNMAMVMMAAGALHAGHSDVAEIETAYHTLTPLLGIGAAGVFLLSLIVSGVSSSTVGTMAGQMIMQGFVGFPHSDLAPQARNHAAGLRCRRAGRQCHAGARHQPGRAEHRPAASHDLPPHLHPTTRHHGSFANSLPTHMAALLGTALVLLLNSS